MKICMPTNGDKGLTEKVFGHFGSAKFFTIYDTESGSIEVLVNGNSHHSHGTCHPMQGLVGHNIDAVLSGGMGRRAIGFLNEMKIKVFQLEDDTVESAITKFKAGTLKEMTPETACAGHGHGGCT